MEPSSWSCQRCHKTGEIWLLTLTAFHWESVSCYKLNVIKMRTPCEARCTKQIHNITIYLTFQPSRMVQESNAIKCIHELAETSFLHRPGNIHHLFTCPWETWSLHCHFFSYERRLEFDLHGKTGCAVLCIWYYAYIICLSFKKKAHLQEPSVKSNISKWAVMRTR